MSKETYLEMCEEMEIEPDPDKIPVEVSDLSFYTQQVLYIMGMLPDKIGEMSGTYIGKDFTPLVSLLELFEVDKRDWLLYVELLNVCVESYRKVIMEHQKQSKKLSEAKHAKEGVNVHG